MTVIAAYDDEDRYWIASDSVGSAGGVKYELGSKLIQKGNYIIGFSWSYRVADIIRESRDLPDRILSIQDVRNMRDIIRATMIKDGLLNNNDESDARRSMASGHPVDVTLISPSGIYTIESDYQIHKITTGYIASGSGTEVAIGALFTCKKLGVDGKQAVKVAVNSAIKHITTCGGKCHIKSVGKK